jgi:hypothetical protein
MDAAENVGAALARTALVRTCRMMLTWNRQSVWSLRSTMPI